MFSSRSGLLGLTALLILLAARVCGGMLGGADSSSPPSREPLPQAPEGCLVRALTSFTPQEQEPVRLAAHPFGGRLYVLGAGGDVTELDPALGKKRLAWAATDYLEQPPRQQVHVPLPVDTQWINAPLTLRATLCLGLTVDRTGRLYIVANVQIPDAIWVNRVDIYRTDRFGPTEALPRPRLWTRFEYPYGVGGFNHGACRIAQGPDGLIYLGSGSRTDHGEAGDEPNISRSGETPYTACILRFDPRKGQQEPEVYSQGNRNPFGFDWDEKGRLIDAEHGPMADHPEELNHIQQGKHYGFPYVFGNGEKPDYPDSPKAPEGLRFEPPIRNVGPGGILGVNPMYSLTPHSAPGGLVFYRTGQLPRRFDHSFFLARFGNLVNYNRIGFDVLTIRLEEKQGQLIASTERFLDRLGRPIDLCVSGGKLYILEYCRQNETAGPGSEGYTAGGRILEVSGGH